MKFYYGFQIVILSLFFLSAVQSSHNNDDIRRKSFFSSIVDKVVHNTLQTLKTTLEKLEIPDFKEKFNDPSLKSVIVFPPDFPIFHSGSVNLLSLLFAFFYSVTFSGENIKIKNAEHFENPYLSTSLIPLTINNFTLTWKNITVSADYDIDGVMDFDFLQSKTNIFGRGKGR